MKSPKLSLGRKVLSTYNYFKRNLKPGLRPSQNVIVPSSRRSSATSGLRSLWHSLGTEGDAVSPRLTRSETTVQEHSPTTTFSQRSSDSIYRDVVGGIGTTRVEPFSHDDLFGLGTYNPTLQRAYNSGDQINGEFTAISTESIEHIIHQIFSIPGHSTESEGAGQVLSIYFEMTIDILDLEEDYGV